MKNLKLIVMVGLAAGVLALVFGAQLQSQDQGRKPEMAPGKPRGPAEFRPDVTDDNRPEHARGLKGQIMRLSGPETRGKPAQIGGKPVQLPADAFVKAFVVAVDCDPEQFCPDELPALIIERAKARAWVGFNTGKTMRLENAQGREELFDFLPGQRGRGRQ